MSAAPSPFGFSLKLENGDLVLDAGGFAVVDGTDNLIQALTLRVLTPYGSDRVNTGYGLDVSSAFTQPLGLGMVKEMLRLNLIRTLGTDPRVSEVRDVVFDDDPDFPGGPTSAAGHRDRLWRVAVTIETIQAGTTTLVLDVEV